VVIFIVPAGVSGRKLQIFGDLISYQNNGKGCTAIVDKVE
jgi:hypothetical protein